ncbi:MAG: hypothetical protein LBF74_10075 [Treponema sp.]|jgi:hypothetical protein|nr:hypothetical protein [Treponema sp.]
MAFQRSVILVVCVSLGAGFLSFLLFRPSDGGGSYGGYGVLVLDESCSDRVVGAALTAAGIETYFSESNQWVYLDDFGELVKVPLDEYPARLEPFDPRNDGYAEKLRAFFVRDGTRRFFIPFNPDREDSRTGIADRLNAVLGDTPYTLEVLIQNQSSSRYWVLFAVFGAAVLFSLVLSETPALLAFLLPLCIPLVFLGSPGLVLTGALFAFSGSLIPLVQEFFVRRRGGISPFSKPPGGRREFPLFSCLMFLLFALVYGALLCIGNVPALAALAVLLLSCGVTGTALWAESVRAEHVRFRPAPIKKPALTIPAFFRYFKRNCPRTILPWVPAAVLALVLPLLLPEPDTEPSVELSRENIPLVYAGDYEAHLAFQRSFSLRLLEDTGTFSSPSEYLPYSGYYRYAIGADGLIMETGREDGGGPAQTGVEAAPIGDYGVFPPFPLADLTGFLTGYTPAVNYIHIPEDLISIALILIPTFSSLIRFGRRERKGGSSLVFNDKRIAA